MSTVPQDPEKETENQRLITEEASIHASRRRWTRHLGAVGRWTRSTFSWRTRASLIAVLSLPGELFLRMLKMLILPLIIFSLIGRAGLARHEGSWDLGWRTVAYYLTTTVVAAVLGLVW
ncbi:Excitatory amino acid transporter 2 [Geodia barretti]|uniref:Amino acid transporter n=1 Tax=Geodia barretti TaxID=519541 RepID=A0AA35WVB6_GEOBA|nr:Excitatory amino acid transporter 2 [Geodia barretti]